jgi:hypothetical protein
MKQSPLNLDIFWDGEESERIFCRRVWEAFCALLPAGHYTDPSSRRDTLSTVLGIAIQAVEAFQSEVEVYVDAAKARPAKKVD